MTAASTTPKFKVNDQVNKKVNSGVYLYVGSKAGTITEVKEKFNVRGRICYYYGVKWPDGRSSEHAQHILVPVK
tara:strand:- start:637 stop:858 length:222 start_codon:yes stop_codon:yes gene_type:complete